ncbi:hypothetical protein OPT61_g7519 [Boeremia exigua]|uniref:Uncharacterized protein n=1 Tax=Boeremia exigua TaxID=749465 RepID=A0ACC2I1X6_9PLEO|nr:hypothetical protein OPT61_g7519 [Boeremia exigua]
MFTLSDRSSSNGLAQPRGVVKPTPKVSRQANTGRSTRRRPLRKLADVSPRHYIVALGWRRSWWLHTFVRAPCVPESEAAEVQGVASYSSLAFRFVIESITASYRSSFVTASTMAIIQPTCLAPKQPPHIYSAQLTPRDASDVISVRQSSCFAAPPVDQPRNAPEAKMLARANAIRHGFVQDYLRSTTVGELTSRTLMDHWDKGGFTKICKDITNWTLDVAALEKFPPSQESVAAHATRQAKIQNLKDNISTLREDYKRMYKQNFLSASKSAANNAYAKRQMELWQPLVDHDVQPVISSENMVSLEELKSARLVPLAKREWADRLVFWRSRLTPDVIASHFHRCPAFVDIKATIDDPSYKVLFAKRLPVFLDAIHLYIFTKRDVLARLRCVQDLNFHLDAYVPDETKHVYAQIRKWNDTYSSHLLRIGRSLDWKDLPAVNDVSHN